jgi:hypothetical protein
VASSSDGAARWRVGCDACGFEAWIGERADGADAWCESCQRATRLSAVPAPDAPPACAACGTPLTTGAPRFVELFGMLQNLDAVLAARLGDPAPLAALLPERPRFLPDLTPPDPALESDPALATLLARLAAGEFHDAAAPLAAASAARPGDPALARAAAIAATRIGDAASAALLWDRALAAAEDPIVRLDRGVMRARAGDFAGARADFALAGATREARWNCAALGLLEAAAAGAPDDRAITRARGEAGPPSAYWSDFTVGRLAWTLAVERELDRTRHGAGGPGTGELEAAERRLEFDTFWDRALVLHGYAVLGRSADAARAGDALAARGAAALAAEPFARGAGPPLAPAIAEVTAAVAAGRAGEARAAVRALLARAEVSRYALPCRACGRGAIGVLEVEEALQPE